MEIISTILSGLVPTSVFSFFALFVPLLLWLVGRNNATRHHITTMHNASFAVSYWEELLFRGVIWGIIIILTHNVWLALTVSSLLFGLFHLRNSWWASKQQLLSMCLYTGLVFAPIIGLVRIWSGDIYLGIALHALHNFLSMHQSRTRRQPKDEYLKSRRSKMNWFQRLFSWHQ